MQARAIDDLRTHAYRVYVTDSLQLAVQNKYLTQRWADLISNNVDTRSGDEVALDVIRRAGLRLKGSEEE